MSEKLYSVVRFSDNAVDFVPSKWICYDNNRTTVPFPKKRTAVAENSKKNSDSEPNPKWQKWEVEIITGSNDAAKAEKKAAKYVETSDIESSSKETEPSRKKKRTEDHPQQLEVPLANLHRQNTANPIQTGSARLQLVNSSVSLPVNEVQSVDASQISNLANFQGSHMLQSAATTTASVFPESQEYIQLVDDTLSFPLALQDPTANRRHNNTYIPPTTYQIQGCHHQPTLDNILKEFREFQEKSLQNQAIFLTEQREIKSLLLNVLEHRDNDKESPAQDTIFSCFPLQDESQLNKANEEISERCNFEKLVKVLSRFGRSSPAHTINSMLTYLFEHEVSKTIRYTQSSGKIPFGNLRLAEALREVTRRTHVTIKDKEVNERIAAWFRGSEDRAGGRKIRHGNSKKNSEKKSQEDSRDRDKEHSSSEYRATPTVVTNLTANNANPDSEW